MERGKHRRIVVLCVLQGGRVWGGNPESVPQIRVLACEGDRAPCRDKVATSRRVVIRFAIATCRGATI
ncbi:hypothetical protein Taro_014570 [Colocasia esculenta]|uniref:Uncharacterized protein n=1 Tax=Colocasia esculenta TaxID=4460 RepID=A0A843UJS9_COLES|nr:hypothetical protein [Colocasia esculenta]